ncbi:30S ribosomal protein S7 [Chloroflexota bacterium]
MPRRARATKRVIPPDYKYQNTDLAKFINKIMICGKKTKSERIVYDALDIIEQETKKSPIEIFEQALRTVTPVLKVKPRRVGGATYQVPVEVNPVRGRDLAMRWLIQSVRTRSGKPIAQRLAAELLDASRGQGVTIKKRDDTHSMAEANKAFVHYRW